MKALSVRQPWAYLICARLKDVENRTRKTNYRGKVLIHSPANDDKRYPDCFTDQQWIAINEYFKGDLVREPLHSCIIGSIEIIDCIQGFDSIWAEANQWHWLLKNPVLFDKPVLNVPGKLGIWDYEGDYVG